jgi:hypothetical protein
LYIGSDIRQPGAGFPRYAQVTLLFGAKKVAKETLRSNSNLPAEVRPVFFDEAPCLVEKRRAELHAVEMPQIFCCWKMARFQIRVQDPPCATTFTGDLRGLKQW